MFSSNLSREHTDTQHLRQETFYRRAQRIADTLVAALLVVASEALVVSLIFGRELVGAWEVRWGLRFLVPIAWAAAAPVALLGFALLSLVRRAAQDTKARRALTLVAMLGASAVGVGVSQGRHLTSFAVRIPFVCATAAFAAGVTFLVAPWLGRAVHQRPVAIGLGACLCIVGFSLANARILPHLYPTFHVALAVLTLLAAPAASLLWSSPTDGFEPQRASRWNALFTRLYIVASALALIGAVGLSPLLWSKLSRADNLRFVYGERGPLLRYAIQLASLVLSRSAEAAAGQGSDELSGAPAADPLGLQRAEGSTTEDHPQRDATDWRNRDIVLITLDALRADHVSAYGYSRPTTPAIDALAAAGARFEYAYCATPHTSYSVTSMMTGKYIRPLLLQGVGSDSDTFAKLLRVYGYRTAAFYPPAVFFIDQERFTALRDRGLDFEYRRVEFAPAPDRAAQVKSYLDKLPIITPETPEPRPIFLWVHLFEPHEPYEKHPDFNFGDRDIDRYDSEIASADAGVGQIVSAVREKRPHAVFLITADHGEEFGEHGGRYHGTSVYEEQVRVPLIIHAPGLISPRVIRAPVQTIDLLPTVLAALRIPRPARVRGHDLGAWLALTPQDGNHDGKDGRSRSPEPSGGFAFAETDEATLLADGPSLRLVCARRLGACQLYDLSSDPAELHDQSTLQPDRFNLLRARLREMEASHGKLELAGLRAEGRAWPEAIRRGLTGDADAALDVTALLDDADVNFRRKAAEVLFELARKETAPFLRISLTRDEDDTVRRWSALALTRMGEGVGRTPELIEDHDLTWRRLAALALAENGDARGEEILVRWWQTSDLPIERAKQILTALARIRSKLAVVPLMRSLADVRLRPLIAEALATIGEPAARPALLGAFLSERYIPMRQALAAALVTLGAGAEMAPPLARFLGVPDPLPNGVELAQKGHFLTSIGGPNDKELTALQKRQATVDVVSVVVPRGGRAQGGMRLWVRGSSRVINTPSSIRIGLPLEGSDETKSGRKSAPEVDPHTALTLTLPAGADAVELNVELPPSFGAQSGHPLRLAIDRPDGAALMAIAVVPLADELPPPAPEPWTPSAADRGKEMVDDGT